MIFPVLAILFQSLLSIVFILTSTFEQVIVIIGFTLNLFTFMTVLGVFVLRRKRPELKTPFKTMGYPYLPGLFLILNIWILGYGFLSRPHESLAGIGVTLAGLAIYFAAGRRMKLYVNEEAVSKVYFYRRGGETRRKRH